MRILDTSVITTAAGLPIKKGTLDFLQAAYIECLQALGKNITSNQSGYIVLWGCENSGSSTPGGTATISAGAIFKANTGLIYLVPAASFVIGGGETIVGDSVVTNYTNGAEADPVTLTDGSVVNVHKITTIVFSSAASGSGLVDFSSIIRPIYKKTIPIGSWNCNVSGSGDATKVVDISTYGIPRKKILSVSAMLYDDLQLYPNPINILSSTNVIQGGVLAIPVTNEIELSIRTGGFFDDSGFSDTGISRGFLIIEYIG